MNLTTQEIKKLIDTHKLEEFGFSDWSMCIFFLGMGVKTIDGRHICPSYFVQNNFSDQNLIDGLNNLISGKPITF